MGINTMVFIPLLATIKKNMLNFKSLYFIILISNLILSCSSFRNNLIASGNQNQAIKNAIIDFSHTSKLYKEHKVFEVEYIDTLYRKVLEKIDERNSCWVNGEPYQGIIAINISAMTNEFTYLLSDSLGFKKDNLPSRYIEQDGKFFFWKDNQFKVNEKTVEVLKKYNVVREDYLNPTFVVHESQKAVDYYICRSDFTKYEKVTTSKAIGYYDAPEIDCE
ncbi:hypothetical protein [Mangrovimonas sp. DI 80]|uniref:hypothetical protein n=1 Tax=Mangrovimonas sp. DI 80 TaxID=1779330 RepID=UPI0009784989|nr:hypothetical protein [Mangrovimonas sp. DI 80]OMP29724.1 hypothetical protein BKM32_15600 [Mangrovimonas sp. DI 80]